MATSYAKARSGNWPGTCPATSATFVSVGGLVVLICCNGEVMITLRPKGGTPVLDGRHAVRGARAGPVGSKGNKEIGSAASWSDAGVCREGNVNSDAGGEGAGTSGGPVDPKGAIKFVCR